MATKEQLFWEHVYYTFLYFCAKFGTCRFSTSLQVAE